MAFINENDIRTVLPKRDIDILLEKDVLGNPEQFLTQRVKFAIEFVASKIRHRYDFAQIFIDLNNFSITATYAIGAVIYYELPAYSATTTYNPDDRVSFIVGNTDTIYKHIGASPTTGTDPTNTSTWQPIVQNKTLYTAIASTLGNFPESGTHFNPEDDRAPLILNYTLYIAIYELFKKVQPSKIPEWILESRTEAIEHLDRFSNGRDSLELPVRTDDDGNETGQRITWGFGSEKQDYDF